MGICGGSKKDQPIISNIAAVNPNLQSKSISTGVLPTQNNQSTEQKQQLQFKTTPSFNLKKDPPSPKNEVKENALNQPSYLSQEGAFKRRAKGHRTVMLNIKDQRKIKVALNQIQKPLDTKEDNIIEAQSNNMKFIRRNKKSTTLIEKSRLGNSIFKEELKLCVQNKSLVGESGDDPTKKYDIISKLGDGSYGTVFLAINFLTKSKVAIKKIVKVKENEIDDLNIKNEIDILKNLDHPNIVKIYEFHETQDSYYIVTEYCKKGELYGYIKNQYSERQLAVLFYQVFSGLCYLHGNNILHRDLKLENILISEVEKDIKTKETFFTIKIIDFGTAKIFQRNKTEKVVVGSSYYIAPEVFKHKYNEKCDTWSVGVILYMLIVGRAPFDGIDDNEIIEKIKEGKYNSNHKKLLACSTEVQDLLKRLLDVNTETRLSAREALNHQWFKSYGGRSLYSNFEKDELIPYIDNLFNYKYQSKFQQLVLAFVVHNIPHSEETKNILKLFRFLNLAGDCKLTKLELTNGLCYFKKKEDVDKVIDDIFILLDGDNDGVLEYEEFLRACLDKQTVLNDSNLKYAFNFLDKNKSKTLNVQKIMSAFVKKGNKILEEIFQNTIKEVDSDHDGEITFHEFKILMLNVS